MPNIWIKICGITRQQDALAASELGADAIGLVFYPASARAVTLDQACMILQDVPDTVDVVALFVDPLAPSVHDVVEAGLVDYLQFHGQETAEFCESFGLPYMKAFRVQAGQDLKSGIGRYVSAEMILLDSFDEKAPGGTGKVFDWSQATPLAQEEEIKLVLAGGLNPNNIGLAIDQVNPYGVDVSSGVEQSPGIKDPLKMKLFMEGARSVRH